MKSPIQLGKPPYPIHFDEEEKPPKSKRKTLMKRKLCISSQGNLVLERASKRANASITA